MVNALLICFELSYTGSPKAVYNMAKGFCDLGVGVSVWALTDGPFKKEFAKIDVPVLVIDKQDIFNNIVSLEAFDFCVAHTVFCADVCYFAEKYLTSYLYIHEAENLSGLVKDCNLPLDVIKSIKNIICVSDYAKNCVGKFLGRKDIVILENFVDRYKVHKRKKRESRKYRFIVSGTIESRKGQEIAILAFSNMKEEYRNNSELHILGGCPEWSLPYFEKIKSLAGPNVYFHEAITNLDGLFSFYEEQDTFIVPSYDESCSLVALEGAMLKKALIVSRNVGAQYVVADKENVFVTGDYNELSCLMNEHVANVTKSKKYGKRNYSIYRKVATYKKYLKRLKRLVKEIKREGNGKC